jgi:hypothetical protein
MKALVLALVLFGWQSHAARELPSDNLTLWYWLLPTPTDTCKQVNAFTRCSWWI